MDGKSLLDQVFNVGIPAVRDVLVARESNDPTPNNRGQNDRTAPAGTPATDTFVETITNPTTLILLVAVAVGIYLLVRR